MQEGQILGGRYRLGRQLGTGSFGRVYEGHHTSLTQRVAIKVFRKDIVELAGGLDRVLDDVKAASKVHHRAIVDVYDLGKVEDTVYVATELVLGNTLHEHLARAGRLPWARAHGVALQIAAALKAAHKRNVLHRGLRAANCFVLEDPKATTDELRIKVSDFGFAHPGLAGGGRGEQHTSPFVGDAGYTAPELSQGAPPSVHSDVYAFGVLLHRILSGALPFEESNAFQILLAHVERPVPPLRSKVRAIPEAVEALVLRALAKDPRKRFESARDLELALESIPADAADELEEDEAAPEKRLEELATGQHQQAQRAPAPPARDEAMHAAFERREEDDREPPSTSLFDRRLLMPYIGAVIDDRGIAPEPTIQLGAAAFGRMMAGAHGAPVPAPAPLPYTPHAGAGFEPPYVALGTARPPEPLAMPLPEATFSLGMQGRPPAPESTVLLAGGAAAAGRYDAPLAPTERLGGFGHEQAFGALEGPTVNLGTDVAEMATLPRLRPMLPATLASKDRPPSVLEAAQAGAAIPSTRAAAPAHGGFVGRPGQGHTAPQGHASLLAPVGGPGNVLEQARTSVQPPAVGQGHFPVQGAVVVQGHLPVQTRAGVQSPVPLRVPAPARGHVSHPTSQPMVGYPGMRAATPSRGSGLAVLIIVVAVAIAGSLVGMALACPARAPTSHGPGRMNIDRGEPSAAEQHLFESGMPAAHVQRRT